MDSAGLEFQDVVIGEGREISRGALVQVHYEGRLSDGSMFDSSQSKGRPFQFVFGTGRVIKGWDLGLVGMRVGGKRNLLVPSRLAYGERKIGDKIPPHSDLSFTIELLEVLTRED